MIDLHRQRKIEETVGQTILAKADGAILGLPVAVDVIGRAGPGRPQSGQNVRVVKANESGLVQIVDELREETPTPDG